MVTNILLLLIIILLLIFLSIIWPPDSPWWFTKTKKIKDALKLAKLSENDLIYDLGCGDARALIIAAKDFGAKGVGIEIDPLRYFISKLLVKLNGVSDKVKIIKKNFFDVNLSDADVVYVYLVPKALERLRPKLLKELKPGTRVLSIKYKIDLPLVREIDYDGRNKINLYKIP